jgi:spore coat polysaccharide biosynthesis protein SpsF
MVVAIIQARMGSTRLPGKVLIEVDGKPLLAYQLDRVLKSKKLDKVIIATSILEKDNEIESFCFDYGVSCYRGSENDVMSRYYDCAKKYNADTIVRMTADCPLIDPEFIDRVVQKFEDDNVDYCGNTVPPETSKFPDGSDVEVFSMNALEMANQSVIDSHFREHVTFQFWQTSEYKSTQYTQNQDYSKHRITVDYPEDFEVVKFIFQKLRKRRSFGRIEEIIEIIESNVEIQNKNSQYFFGQGWNK